MEYVGYGSAMICNDATLSLQTPQQPALGCQVEHLVAMAILSPFSGGCLMQKDKTVTFIHFHTMVLLNRVLALVAVSDAAWNSSLDPLPDLPGVVRLQFLEKNKSSFGCSERYPVCDTPGT